MIYKRFKSLCTALACALFLAGSPTALFADTTSPSIVNGLGWSAGSDGSITITWNRPWDDTDVEGYNLYRNGAYLTTVRDTRFNDTAVGPNSTYTYQISAFDPARNFSELSETIVATTGGQQNNDVRNQVDQNTNASGQPSNGAPVIPTGLRGAEISPGSVRWQWNRIDSAAQYEVTVDGSLVGVTGETQYVSNNLWTGDHSLSVKSITADNRYSSQSDTFKLFVSNDPNSVINQPAAAPAAPEPSVSQNNAGGDPVIPTGLRGVEVAPGTVRWEWDWIPTAAQYEVTVDGVWAGITGEPQFFSENLWRGDHSVSIKSITADNRYSAQSDTFKLFVNNDTNAGGQAVAVAPPAPQAAPATPASDNGLIDPQTWTQPNVGRDGYDLVFSDEFNGNAINTARWTTNFRWDGEFNGERYEYRIINNEDQFYVSTESEDPEHRALLPQLNNPFEFDGSRLAIRATRNPLKSTNDRRLYGPLRDVAAAQTFLSGAISTHNSFNRMYGYFEARIKIPSHTGTFPAFWLFHQRQRNEGTRRTEIDIMENLGHAPWFIYNTMHFFDNVSESYAGDANFLRPDPTGQIFTGTDYSQDYHVYAVEWRPGYVQWLIDGVKTSEIWHPSADFEPLYIIINLALGGNFTNFPTTAGGLGRPQSERFPTDNDINQFANPALEIDWVRVYAPR